MLFQHAALDVPRLFYAFGFDARVQEYESVGLEEAHLKARRGRVNPCEGKTIISFFVPDANASRRLGSIRLALLSGAKALYVDASGTAILSGRRGRFDVVSFERFVRSSLQRARRLGTSPLVSIRIINKRDEPIRILSHSEAVSVLVLPRSSQDFTTWFTRHTVLAHHVEIGRIPTGFLTRRKSLAPDTSLVRVRQTSPRPDSDRTHRTPPWKPRDRGFEVVVG